MTKLLALFVIPTFAMIVPASAGDETSGSELGAFYQNSDAKIAMFNSVRAKRERDEVDLQRLFKTAPSPIIEQRHIVKKNDLEYLVTLSWIDLRTFASKSLVYRVATKDDLLETGYTSGGNLNQGSMAQNEVGYIFDPKKSSWAEAATPNLLAASRFPIDSLLFARSQRVKREIKKLQRDLVDAKTAEARGEFASDLAFLNDAEGEITLSPEARIDDPGEYLFNVGEGGYIESLEVRRDGALTERLTNRFTDTPIDFSISDSEIGSRISENLKKNRLKRLLVLGFYTSKITGEDVVSRVIEDTPAKLVGIKPGDVIVSMTEAHNHPESTYERSSEKDYLYKIEVRSREGKASTFDLRPVVYLMLLPKEKDALAKTIEGMN